MKKSKLMVSFLILLVIMSCASKNQTLEDILTESEDNKQANGLGFEGVGTKPLWAFRYVGGSLIWQEPGMKGSNSYSAPGKAGFEEGSENISIVAGDFSAVLTAETCDDGVSENEYTYSVKLTKDTRVFSGCAREYIK